MGFDTASKLDAAEVSRIAVEHQSCPSTYLAVVPDNDDPRTHEDGNKALNGDLADLARWTGGDLFVATSTPEASNVARAIVGVLRDQYLIAIEPGTKPGWHPWKSAWAARVTPCRHAAAMSLAPGDLQANGVQGRHSVGYSGGSVHA